MSKTDQTKIKKKKKMILRSTLQDFRNLIILEGLLNHFQDLNIMPSGHETDKVSHLQNLICAKYQEKYLKHENGQQNDDRQ